MMGTRMTLAAAVSIQYVLGRIIDYPGTFAKIAANVPIAAQSFLTVDGFNFQANRGRAINP
jgi:hypothetical protein